jgi:dihydroorotase
VRRGLVTGATFLLVGARVIDPGAGEDGVRDVAVLDGRLVAPAEMPDGAPRVAGDGLVAAPGFVDLHAHLREPGDEGAETIATATAAAARGGFTTVCAMPNTTPALDDAALLSELDARAAGCAARVRWIGAVTAGRRGETLADLEALAAAGAVAFSDDGAAVTDALSRAALERIAALDLPLIEHAEDAALAAGSVMRAGPTAVRLGLRGWPPEAELACVERDLALAEQTGARLHLTHLSTAGALDAVRAARSRGVRVTCDVTPHPLALTTRGSAAPASSPGRSRPTRTTRSRTTGGAGSIRHSPPGTIAWRSSQGSPTARSTPLRPTMRRIPRSASSSRSTRRRPD